MVRKEGWLTKTNPRGKKQERHFKLTGSMLAWSKLATVRRPSHAPPSARPDAPVKDRKDLNTIDLTQAKLSMSPTDACTIIMRCSSLGKGKEKDYILSSPDAATTKAWFEAIKAAQESVRTYPVCVCVCMCAGR